MQAARARTEAQRTKLANSYHELLTVFASEELNSVGNYTLGRLIGKGSFGKVYLATHKLTNGSKVVLKSAKKSDPNLAREIHHHRQFLHPHIARLYEVIVTESLVWLVLEYCPGNELYAYLLRNGPLPVDKVQRIFAQLVGAVSYVHNQSCVHRDLKLENILLDKQENVKLVDFGFTREYEKMKNHLQTFCGTVCYSAPEMLRGEKYAGEKVDVWSLGVILYALLTGELPFDDDDDLLAKHKILNTEPAYTERIPPEAKALITKLLSKRPLLRPSLSDILNDPFLAEHAAAQQAILKLARPAPFTTALETDCLQRMRSAGVDIDRVIENVLAQRMDALGGWWALLIEKEERKAARRERKRKEKEQELKNLRRISAASSRMMTPTLREVEEESQTTPQARGRQNRRSFPSSLPDLPRLPEGTTTLQTSSTPPPPPPKNERVRSMSSSSRHPPPPLPLKDREVRRRSRPPSQLGLTAGTPELVLPRRRGRRNVTFLFSTIKHWIVELPKRARSPHMAKSIASDGTRPTTGTGSSNKSPNNGKLQRPAAAAAAGAAVGANTTRPSPMNPERNSPTAARSQAQTALQIRGPVPRERSPLAISPLSTPRASRTSNNHTVFIASSTFTPRPSLSPAPLTPRSSYRRGSAGLRGRKSTSSSVSSVRSIHHVHTHSKTSSTSSNVDSIVSSAFGSADVNARSAGRDKPLPHHHHHFGSSASSGGGGGGSTPGSGAGLRSPHSPAVQSSIKVLPATPTLTSFPSGIRVARGPPAPLHLITSSGRDPDAANNHAGGIPGLSLANTEYAFGGPMPSPGLVFAKRKRTPFKGPMLSLALEGAAAAAGSGASGVRSRSREKTASGPRRSSSVPRVWTGLATTEEDENEDGPGEEDIEEVDAFSPIERDDEEEIIIFDPPGPAAGTVEPGEPDQAAGGTKQNQSDSKNAVAVAVAPPTMATKDTVGTSSPSTAQQEGQRQKQELGPQVALNQTS